jgi:hypothetical protein
MIRINEACAILGLPEDDKGKAKAREVLNYFGVNTSEESLPEGKFGKPSKLYDAEEVRIIARFKATEFAQA